MCHVGRAGSCVTPSRAQTRAEAWRQERQAHNGRQPLPAGSGSTPQCVGCSASSGDRLMGGEPRRMREDGHHTHLLHDQTGRLAATVGCGGLHLASKPVQMCEPKSLPVLPLPLVSGTQARGPGAMSRRMELWHSVRRRKPFAHRQTSLGRQLAHPCRERKAHCVSFGSGFAGLRDGAAIAGIGS